MTRSLDLAVIVPDLDIENTMQALLEKRTQSLDIRPLHFRIYRYPQRDPGLRVRGAEFARGLLDQHLHCLLILDYHGSGAEKRNPPQAPLELENEIRTQMRTFGWGDKAEVITIQPELEAWLWGRELHLSQAIGWDRGPLDVWLTEHKYPLGAFGKPEQPKEALEAVLRIVGRPLSASLYRQVASECSLLHCRDEAFNRLRGILRAWFPPSVLGPARY